MSSFFNKHMFFSPVINQNYEAKTLLYKKKRLGDNSQFEASKSFDISFKSIKWPKQIHHFEASIRSSLFLAFKKDLGIRHQLEKLMISSGELEGKTCSTPSKSTYLQGGPCKEARSRVF